MWFDEQYLSSLISLVTAAVLGGVIGFERAGKNHDAGLRTHILVCLGSATVTVLSKYLAFDYKTTDIMRLGAQVISGIGFLGVGCIIVTGDRVKGLTTAAGLWTTACVGLVVGMGYYLIAITVVVLMMTAILGLRPIAIRFQGKSYDFALSIIISDKSEIGNLLLRLSEQGIIISAVKLNEEDGNSISILIEGHSKRDVDIDTIISRIYLCNGIKEVHIS